MQQLDNTMRSMSGDRVSAHAGIDKDGTIHLYVTGDDAAWAVGRVNTPDQSVIGVLIPNWQYLPREEYALGGYANPRTLNIENVGRPGEPFPKAQMDANIELAHYLVGYYPSLQPSRTTLTGHFRLDSINRANCPGTGFDWDRYYASFGI